MAPRNCSAQSSAWPPFATLTAWWFVFEFWRPDLKGLTPGLVLALFLRGNLPYFSSLVVIMVRGPQTSQATHTLPTKNQAVQQQSLCRLWFGGLVLQLSVLPMVALPSISVDERRSIRRRLRDNEGSRVLSVEIKRCREISIKEDAVHERFSL